MIFDKITYKLADKLVESQEKLNLALFHCNEALARRNIEGINSIYEIEDKIRLIEADNTVRNSIIEGTITEFADETLSIVGDYAFYDCTSLSSIDLPECNYVGSSAFGNCTALTSVNLPMCSYIGMFAFENCTSLTAISLGYSSVATLCYGALNNTPISNSTYTGSFGSIYVPASLVEAYKVANDWSAYADRITAMEVLENE